MSDELTMDGLITDEQVSQLVAAVIARLAPRLGADGRRGRVIVAFSGAVAPRTAAIEQCRRLVLAGYQLRLACSDAAESIVGADVRVGLAGFPNVSDLDATHWLDELAAADAVICPTLTVNTLAKLALLIADSLVLNLLIHGLLRDKPVVLGRDAIDRASAGTASPALRRALAERLHTAAAYGCHISAVSDLCAATRAVVANAAPAGAASTGAAPAGAAPRRVVSAGPLVTATDIRRAHREGVALALPARASVTPLASDLALQLGVQLTRV